MPMTLGQYQRTSVQMGEAFAFSYTWSFEFTPRYFLGRNDINQSFTDDNTGERSFRNYLSPQLDSEYGAVYVATQHQLDYQDSAYAGTVLLMMDTGEIYRDNLETLNENTGMEESSDAWLTNGQTLRQEFRSTYFLRMLHLKQTFGPTNILLSGQKVIRYWGMV